AATLWKLTVTELGGSTAMSEITVEAENWVDALRLGKGRLGEDEKVLDGSSCVFSPEGDVILHDPGTHRTYRLTPSASAVGATPPPEPAAQALHQAPEEPEGEVLLLQNRIESEPRNTADTVTWELFTSRTEEPTPENPLHYRERSYIAAGGVSPEEAERFLCERFEELRESLRDASAGKYFQMAVFDHRWA